MEASERILPVTGTLAVTLTTIGAWSEVLSLTECRLILLLRAGYALI